jgi:hypothetical protein
LLPSRIQIFQNPAKPSKGNQRKSKEKRLGFSWIPLSESSLFNRLRRRPGKRFSFLAPLFAVGLGQGDFVSDKNGTMISDFRKDNLTIRMIPFSRLEERI